MVKDTPSNPEKPKRSYHYTREHQLEIEANKQLRNAKKKAQKAAVESQKAKQKAKQIEEALHKKEPPFITFSLAYGLFGLKALVAPCGFWAISLFEAPRKFRSRTRCIDYWYSLSR